ncbi:14810_t:CDS:2, partial [Funneliformis geosporum]
VTLGEFEEGELCFPQLKIIIPLRPNQLILSPSAEFHTYLKNAQGRNHLTRLNKPKSNQILVPPASTDCRRRHIDLT